MRSSVLVTAPVRMSGAQMKETQNSNQLALTLHVVQAHSIPARPYVSPPAALSHWVESVEIVSLPLATLLRQVLATMVNALI